MKQNMKRKLVVFLLLVFPLFLASCGQKDLELPTLTGADNIVYTIGDPEPDLELGISALDNIDGDLSASVVVDGSAVNFTVPGIYDVIVTVVDAAGNQASITFQVTVQYEQVVPVITGVVDLEFEQGVVDPEFLIGITAEDNADGILTDSITVDDSEVDYDVIGTYTVYYSVSDSAGNLALVEAVIIIRAETVDPVIEGAANLVFGLDTLDPDYLVGLSATDNFDGELTSSIMVDASAVNFAVEGTYPIIYTVTDAAGNSSSITIQVQVKDMVAPIITGTRNLTFEVHSDPNFLWKDIVATDNIDGDVLADIVIDSSQVDTTLLGTYPLTYTVTDSSGNSTSVTVDITIADRTKPVIYANLVIYYLEGDDDPDYLAGVTAIDNYDGDLTSSITVNSSAVNLSVIGSYNVVYTVTDGTGNIGTLTIQLIVPNPTYVLNVDSDAADIDLPTAPLTASIVLPTSGLSGSTITWTSTQPGVMTKNGNIVRPGLDQPDAEVELIATVKSGNYQKQETFIVVVAAMIESNVTSKTTLDYTALGTEYVTSDGVLDTYFVDNGSVPYVDVEDFILLLEGALDTEIIEFVYDGNYLIISYSVEYEDIDGSMVIETMSATFDFALNTFSVDSYHFFEYYVASTTTDYGEGLNYVDADYIDPDSVTFPLGFYGFDLVIYNDLGADVYLMPFHVADLLFAGNVYFDVYYNGDQYYGLDTMQLYDRTDPNIPVIKTSSFNTLTIPQDMKLASYNFMALAMDFFYGIKKFAGVDTYYGALSEYVDSMVYSGDYSFYRSIFDFAYGLDDLHTSHVFAGYYEDPAFAFTLSLSDLGTRSQSYYNKMWSTEDLYEATFGSLISIPFSRTFEDGKTAVIYLDGFDVDTPTAFMRALDDLDPSVENVIVDLANNGGGNLGAVLRIFGYMTEQQITYHSQNPADGSAVTYYIESDYDAYDYNWFVMTSSVTFSAANLFASIAKELGIPLIGQNSSGGASSIGIILPPGGSTLLISTNNVLSTRVMNDLGEYEYLSIEYGISVDYKLVDVTDDIEIALLINQILDMNNN
ncbi:MAG: immunoglobulin-like domain-containing protein [Bacillota bacterium]